MVRVKALSLAYENGGCPILWKFAQQMLCLTEGASIGNIINHKTFDAWEREKLLQAMKKPPPIKEPDMVTRLFYEERFGVPVSEQLQVEKEIELIGLSPFALPSLCVPRLYEQMYDAYVTYFSCDYLSCFFPEFYQPMDPVS
jgi:hypothetical protein